MPPRIVLKSFHNKYLSVKNNEVLSATSGIIAAWEVFYVESLENNLTALKVYPGGYVDVPAAARYIGAEQSGPRVLVSSRLLQETKWTIKLLGDSKIALKSIHGKYLKADEAGTLTFDIARDQWGTWTYETAPENQGM